MLLEVLQYRCTEYRDSKPKISDLLSLVTEDAIHSYKHDLPQIFFTPIVDFEYHGHLAYESISH